MLNRLPPLFLGILIAAYWGRVLRMAYKAWRRDGRAANLAPRERAGKLARLIWVPAVLVWVTQPFFAALWPLAPWLLRPMSYRAWIAWPAVAGAGVCFALSLRCWKTMGRHWRMGIDPAERNPLICSGPFATVRHPIYALSMLMMLATMAMLPSPLMLAAGAVHIALLAWEARREERHMLGVHGPAYAEYCGRVGAFVPRVRSSAG